MKRIEDLKAISISLFLAISLERVTAQEFSTFEIVNNQSIGLTAAPFEKYGMAVHDIDRNGFPDIFCLRWKSPGYSRIFVNEGGRFRDITERSPIERIESEEDNTRTTLWVDYDNDGDRDLSISTDKAIHLLRNDNNAFTDISAEVGFVGESPPGAGESRPFTIGGWADYDADGDLDCVVAQENNPNLYLLRNDGDRFVDTAMNAGLDSTALAGSSELTWLDIDLDGDPDLLSSFRVFRNDDGFFTDITGELGLDEIRDVSYREIFDYDNDGDFDFFKVVGEASADSDNEIWENRDGRFVDVSDDVGLVVSRDRYRSMTVGDFDNNGFQDIFMQLNIDFNRDVLLLNYLTAQGERVLADIASLPFVGITKTGDRKGSAFFDYDGDGFLDLYLPSTEHQHILYHNLANNDANWVGFILEGTVSNRDAVGSLVRVYTPDMTQMRYVKCGSGFVRQDNPYVHFGLGYKTGLDSVVVRWPSGHAQVLTGIAINRYHKIVEPAGTEVESGQTQDAKADRYRIFQNFPNPFNTSTTISFELAKLSSVDVSIYDLEGRSVEILLQQKLGSGYHSVRWDARKYSSGVYLYRIRAGEYSSTGKCLLLR